MSWQTAPWPHRSSARTSQPFSSVAHSCSLARTSPTASSTMPVPKNIPCSSKLYDYMTKPPCPGEYSSIDPALLETQLEEHELFPKASAAETSSRNNAGLTTVDLSCSVVPNTSSSLGFKHGQPTTLSLTNTFPQWIPSPSSQPSFKGLLGSVLLPVLSVCEGLIFLLN